MLNERRTEMELLTNVMETMRDQISTHPRIMIPIGLEIRRLLKKGDFTGLQALRGVYGDQIFIKSIVMSMFDKRKK
jgi:hypothetical protein